jgi:hypothetical protein
MDFSYRGTIDLTMIWLATVGCRFSGRDTWDFVTGSVGRDTRGKLIMTPPKGPAVSDALRHGPL